MVVCAGRRRLPRAAPSRAARSRAVRPSVSPVRGTMRACPYRRGQPRLTLLVLWGDQGNAGAGDALVEPDSGPTGLRASLPERVWTGAGAAQPVYRCVVALRQPHAAEAPNPGF